MNRRHLHIPPSVASRLGMLACCSLLACTQVINELPNESVAPPPDLRPLPEAPTPLTGNTPTVLADGLDEPRGLALNSTHIYVAERAAGRVLKVARADASLEVLHTDLDGPMELALDDDELFISENDGGRVLRRDSEGQLTSLCEQQDQPGRLAVDGDLVYFITEGHQAGSSWIGGALKRVNKAGGTAETLVSDLKRPRGLALGSDAVYFTEGTVPGRLWRLGKQGNGEAEIIGTAEEEAFDCVLDEAARMVLWVSRNPNWPYSGWINQTTLDEQETTRMIHSQAYVNRIGLDAQHAYWSFTDGLHRYQRDGTSPVEPIALTVAIGDFALSSELVFFSDRLSGRLYSTRFNR